jgi:hypothetical protein
MIATDSPGSEPNRFPTFRRAAGWLFDVRRLNRGIFGIACLATLVGLFYGVENWRGGRAWKKCKSALESTGEQLDVAAFIPAPAADDQNFAATPLLKPMLDYSHDPVTRALVWHDTNAAKRAYTFLSWMDGNLKVGPWREAKEVDLEKWQAHFRSITNSYDRAAAQVGGTVRVLPPKLPPAAGAPAGDVLFVLDQLKPEMDELTAALTRPRSRFNVHYEDLYGALLPHLGVLKQAEQTFALRASAELATGRTDDALETTRVALKLSGAPREEPILISLLVREAMIQLALQPVWEGLERHQWSDAQIVELERQLSTIEVFTQLQLGLRGERVFSLAAVDMVRRTGDWRMLSDGSGNGGSFSPGFLTPSGWFDQNKVALAQAIQSYVTGLSSLRDGRFDLTAVRESTETVDRELRESTPYNFFAHLLLPALGRVAQKSAAAQSGIDQARVACALERFRLARGQYPENLDALSPSFLGKVPRDVVNGAPLKYRREADSRYVLYSVGWDTKDSGGARSTGKSGSRDPLGLAEGDWSWPCNAVMRSAN